ncbi:Octanoyltransferase [Porphyromonas levii]|uniref:Octanoyltransferase n=1 Tax=Porphyromonas levii TaxID=28114 RepID=A0A4Y8WRX5_9PORP|nr:lipoyl(octanoyl) transferase LipB [Porphyromonas levii]MBR8728839.1 Octanoyltransferase [Porphyromonas levii]MBR8731204.1 Octanoyltransferase [Porphyromonas levii]TFH97502.1 lipoyl(octanoyl) transferase LipB [Porphyromonas levii]TFH97736.1 lipoyl(octanoyl) transferase LipB [Porphyromonas levii]
MSRNIKVLINREIKYKDSLAQQQALYKKALSDKRQGGEVQHHIIFNEHYPVITLGKHADPHNILFSPELLETKGIDLFSIQRGGDVTYHGPGQWTVYPIFDLEEIGIGLRQYVDNLEEVAIRVAAKYGVVGGRIHGASGVWIDINNHPRKLCAVGIQASRFITMHGIAFNVTTPPNAYSIINPCGFTDKGVTNLSIESGQEISMEQAMQDLWTAFQEVFQRPLTE